ncbi:regulator of G-protein signaling 9-binding protein-like [Penaeus indicus]|uniref:regulator of G-protein signaling 9-binding protein-like n=1 Tax=Penaeus indicus TaxID=29960 RepID=UPI00300CCE79
MHTIWMRGASVSSTGGSGIGSTVTMGGGLPLWIPYCTQSDRRVSTTSNEFSGRGECLKLIRELNRETSHHRHLAVGLGGSGDCERLRDELKRSRRRAQDLARQAKLKLDPHLQDVEAGKPEVIRLWRLLFCCIRVLEQEMLRTLTLQHTFTLHVGPTGLINTGVNEYGQGYRGGASIDNMDLPLDDRLALERAEVNQLHKELIDLRNLINAMEGNLDMKPWILGEITEKQILAAIGEDSTSCLETNEDSGLSDMESEGGGSETSVCRRRCFCWIMTIIFGLLVFTFVGIFIAIAS